MSALGLTAPRAAAGTRRGVRPAAVVFGRPAGVAWGVTLRPTARALAPRPAPCARHAPPRRRPATARPAPRAAAAPGDETALAPARRPLETDAVPRRLLLKVEDAVDSLGGSVTAGDVAGRAGVTLPDAERALAALAADVAGRLQVSAAGDVIYVFPSAYRTTLRTKSWWLRVAPGVDAAVAAAGWAARVAFGGALLASIAIAAAALIAASTAAQGDDRDRRGGRGYYGGGGPMVWLSPGDLFWYFDPYGYRRASRRAPPSERKEGMGFLEAIFSFVFGDGDPNASYDDDRWKMVGRFIASRGGVVTAEQLAPYLDPPVGGSSDGDEAFVVPALVRFDGRPEVTPDGGLLYVFPSLQRTGAGGRRPPPPDTAAALERAVPFTAASPGQRLAAAALGAANVFLVGSLGGALADPATAVALARSSFSFVFPLFPWLQAYALAFFAIPGLRWLLNGRRNATLDARNAARLDALRGLRAPTPRLAAKLSAAAARSARVDVRDDGLVFDTADVASLADDELAAFDRKLAGAGGAVRGGSGGRAEAAAPLPPARPATPPQAPPGRPSYTDWLDGRGGKR